MPEIVEAFVVVDVEGLLQAYPNGLGPHQTGDENSIGRYFDVLASSSNLYDGGVKCDVGDVIRFRSVPQGHANWDVIIQEYGEKNQDLTAEQVTNYVSRPSFQTVRRSGLAYDNNHPAQPFAKWNQWNMWYAITEDSTVEDPYMDVEALQSTASLTGNEIRYTLGFKALVNGRRLDWWFDPGIRVNG